MLPLNITSVLWYIILAVAWTVYLIQEAFIVGSGMLQRLGYDPRKQRSIQLSSGLHYDGIEVWLITAVGGTFAAFPPVYAVTLESLYIPFFLLITAVIIRIITIEFMYKDESEAWQKWMSRLWGISSFLIPFVLGVYFANIFRGLKLDAAGYQGSLFGLFDIIGLAGGLFFTANALVTGAAWIKLTTIADGTENRLERGISFYASIGQTFTLVLLLLGLNNRSDLFIAGPYAALPVLWALPFLAVILSGGTILLVKLGRTGLLFLGGILTMLITMASLFTAAFPKMIISSLDHVADINIYNGSSSAQTLTVMTYVAAVFVPLVLIYQGWKFFHFRKDKNEETLH